MELFSTRNRRSEIYESICSCDSYETLGRKILGPVAEYIGAQSATFFQLSSNNSKPAVIEHFCQWGLFSDVVQQYSRELFLNDPLYLEDPIKPTTYRTLLEKHQRPNSPKFCAYFRALKSSGIGDVVGFYFFTKSLMGDHVIQVGFPRHHHMSGYSLAEIDAFADLSPLIQLAVTGLIHRQEALSLSHKMVTLSSQLSEPIAVNLARNDYTRRDVSFLDTVADPSTRIQKNQKARENTEDIDLVSLRRNDHVLSSLTVREWDIVTAVRAGHSNASTANSLGISVRTVENHLRSIFLKVEVVSRTQLIAKVAHIN